MVQAVRELASRLAQSTWARPLTKALFAVGAVATLALLGRPVTAGGVVPPAAAASTETLSNAPALPSAAPSADHGVVDADAGSSSADAPSPALPPPLVHAAHATTDDPVYLNEASTEDLRRLPGIGEKRARAILELRAKLGRFRQIDDLLRVKGIGRAAIKRLRPLVRLDASDAGR